MESITGEEREVVLALSASEAFEADQQAVRQGIPECPAIAATPEECKATAVHGSSHEPEELALADFTATRTLAKAT